MKYILFYILLSLFVNYIQTQCYRVSISNGIDYYCNNGFNACIKDITCYCGCDGPPCQLINCFNFLISSDKMLYSSTNEISTKSTITTTIETTTLSHNDNKSHNLIYFDLPTIIGILIVMLLCCIVLSYFCITGYIKNKENIDEISPLFS